MTKKILFLFALLISFSCAKRPSYQDPVPLHETFTIDSKKVHEKRVINVWFPLNYKENGVALPVLYMPDGGIVNEDFPHVANTLAELIENKEIEPMILVGIQNTNRRRDLTGFSENQADSIYCLLSDGAKDFRAFITEELMPEIKSRYLITTKKSIIGESLAGLLVIETFLLQPDAFDCYLAFDPSLWWNNQYLVKTATKIEALQWTFEIN